MKTLGFGLIAASATLAYAGPASAQDRCADILRNGTVKLSSYSENSYVRQILVRRFMSSSFESSKTDTSAGGSVPIGEIIMGGKYSRSDYDRKKRSLQNYFKSDMTASREIEVALSSGDETIVGAWTSCMKSRNEPLIVWIEQQGPRRAVVNIEFTGGRGQGETVLNSAVRLPPGVVIESGSEYFMRGARFVAGTRRSVVLTMKDAITPVSVNIDTEAGNAVAYLPPRLIFKRISRLLAVDRLRGSHKRGTVSFARTYTLYGLGDQPGNINLTAQSFGGGPEAGSWFFDTTAPSSLRLLTKRSSRCERLSVNVQPGFVTYGYRIQTKDRNATTICEVSGVLTLVNEVWRSQDDELPIVMEEGLAQTVVKVPATEAPEEKFLVSPIPQIFY